MSSPPPPLAGVRIVEISSFVAVPLAGMTLAALGVYHIFDDLSIFRALSPHYGVMFLIDNGFLGFVILGSVFLAVTGAEALYADMGHFGKKPIRIAWAWVVGLPLVALQLIWSLLLPWESLLSTLLQ